MKKKITRPVSRRIRHVTARLNQMANSPSIRVSERFAVDNLPWTGWTPDLRDIDDPQPILRVANHALRFNRRVANYAVSYSQRKHFRIAAETNVRAISTAC